MSLSEVANIFKLVHCFFASYYFFVCLSERRGEFSYVLWWDAGWKSQINFYMLNALFTFFYSNRWICQNQTKGISKNLILRTCHLNLIKNWRLEIMTFSSMSFFCYPTAINICFLAIYFFFHQSIFFQLIAILNHFFKSSPNKQTTQVCSSTL